MKTKFYKVFSLVLVMTLLVCSGIAAVASNTTPVSNLASIALQGANTVVDGTADKEVTVQLVVQQDLTCYNIEGAWTTETGSDDAITLKSITSKVLNLNAAGNYVNVTNGRVMWVDDTFMAESSAEGTVLLTATYAVSKDTPAGNYTIYFTNRSFTDQTGYPNTEKLALEATIHVCRPSEATGKDATCKEPGYKGHYYCSSCDKLFADAAMTQQIEDLDAWRNDENGGKIPTTNKHTMAQDINNPWTNNGDTHSANMVCKICRNYTELGEAVEHSYDATTHKCVCGAESHAHAEYEVTENGHNSLCSCGKVLGSEDHNYNAEHKCVCGVESHDFQPAYVDEATHQLKCSCGKTSGEAVAHDFTDGDCVCGAEKPAPAGLKGDVNDDGEVDMADLVMVAQHVGEVNEITDEQAFANADIDNNGEIDMADLVKIAQYVGEVIDSLE